MPVLHRVTHLSLMALICLISYSTVLAGQSGCSVTGRVVDSLMGRPVSWATVRLLPVGRACRTDSEGRFELIELRPGQYQLRVSHVGFSPIEVSVEIDSVGAREIEVKMQRLAASVGEMIVTASRYHQTQLAAPQSVTSVQTEEFVRMPFSSTGELLREQPGVLVQKTTHAHGSPIVRGLIGKHILLLYDGIRLNKPTFRFGANQYLSTINPDFLSRIEVARGPSSVLYGSDAIGGVINLIPKRPQFSDSSFHISHRVTGKYSSVDHGWSGHTQVNATRRKLAASYGFSVKRIGDLIGGGNIGHQTPTGWREAGHAASMALQIGRQTLLRAHYHAVRQDKVHRYDKYASGDFRQYVYDPQNRDLVVVRLATTASSPLWNMLNVGISYHREVEGRITQMREATQVKLSRDKVTTWGGFLQMSADPWENHRLSYGMEYYLHRVHSSRISQEGATEVALRPTFPDNSVYGSWGSFLQDEASLSSDLTVTGGVRFGRESMNSPLEIPFEPYRATFTDLTGSLALCYLITPNVNLVGRSSRGFRSPNLNDAVVLKYSSSGVDAPNSELGPETSYCYEIGAKVTSHTAQGSFFVFYNELKDLIDRRPGTYNGLRFFDENGNGIQDSGEQPVFQKANVGRARILGFEFASKIRLSDRLQGRTSLSWTYGASVSDDEPLSRIPPLSGMLAMRTSLRRHLWWEAVIRFSASQRRLSQRDIDDPRIEPGGTSGWAILNTSLQFSAGDITITTRLENLFDRAYKEHGSGVFSPGRGIGVSVGRAVD